MSISSEPADATRREIQRVATHILARARRAADGEISLRVGLTGLATPAFGPDREVLRFAGGHLVREARVGGELRSRAMAIVGSTLSELADFCDVDLDANLDFGHDAPAVGDRTRPIQFDQVLAEALLRWYQIGAAALDQVITVAIDLRTASGRCNLGAASADAFSPQPYLYVGPHGAELVLADPDPVAAAVSFFTQGLRLLG